MFDSHGDIGATTGGPDGVFHADTRYLSRLELLINGMQPLLLGSNVRDDNSLLTVDLTNPDIFSTSISCLPKDTLHVVRTVFLWRGHGLSALRVQNHGDQPVSICNCHSPSTTTLPICSRCAASGASAAA